MIKDLKELEKLLKLCRKQGVTKIELEGCKLELGEMPQAQSHVQEIEVNPDDPWSKFPAGTLTPEQLAYYSAGGTPEEDPFRTDQ